MSAKFEHTNTHGLRSGAYGFKVDVDRTVTLSDDLSAILDRTPGRVVLTKLEAYAEGAKTFLDREDAIRLRDALVSAIADIEAAAAARNALKEAAR